MLIGFYWFKWKQVYEKVLSIHTEVQSIKLNGIFWPRDGVTVFLRRIL